MILFPFMIFPFASEEFTDVPKLIYLILFVCIVWALLGKKREWWTQNIQVPITRVDFLIALFFLLIFISTITSVNPFIAVFGMVDRFEGMIAWIIYLSIFIFSFRLVKVNEVEKLMKGIVVVGILVGIYAIFQHYGLDLLATEKKVYPVRSAGLFKNPNFFGSYLVIVTMFVVPFYLSANNIKNRTYYLTAISLLTIAALFSMTRSSWIGIFLGIAFLTLFLIMKRKHLWKRWTLLVGVLIVTVLIVDKMENGTILSRAGHTLQESQNLLTGEGDGSEGTHRFFIWEKTLPFVKEYFWLGSGPDTLYYSVFLPEQEDFEVVFGTEQYVDKAHNEYLHMAVTMGVPALIMYLLIVFTVLFQAFKSLKHVNGRELFLHYGLIAAIIGYIIQAFFNISVISVAPFFWCLLGITYGLSFRYIVKGDKPPIS